MWENNTGLVAGGSLDEEAQKTLDLSFQFALNSLVPQMRVF